MNRVDNRLQADRELPIMKIVPLLLFPLICLTLLQACSSVSVSDYAENKPVMIVPEFFNGALSAHGIVKNRSGKVIRYFSASINAYWENGIGTLDEVFIFDDGEEQRRIWKLVKDESGSYIGSANDVVGTTRLEAAGNSLFLNYVLQVPYGDDTLEINVDDKMYLVSDRILLNESIMTKWGFEVGQVTLVIEKQSEP